MENVTTTLYPRPATITAAFCAILFCIVGILGNLITVLALIQSPRLRKHATTAFVLSLAVSDLIFCAVNMPLTASRYIHEEWKFGMTMCKIFPMLLYGNVAVSLLSMVAITINRYVLISYNEVYNRIYTCQSIFFQLLFIWGFAFAMLLPPVLGVWGKLAMNEKTFSCTILKDDSGMSPKSVIFIGGFLLPCVVIIVSYTCIYYEVQKSHRKMRGHEQIPTNAKSVRRANREKEDGRLTKLMLIIFICYIVCFLPLMIMNVFDDEEENSKYPALHVIASILAWFSSVINPFVYAASNRQYRSAYKKLFENVKSNVRSVQMNTTSVHKEPPGDVVA